MPNAIATTGANVKATYVCICMFVYMYVLYLLCCQHKRPQNCQIYQNHTKFDCYCNLVSYCHCH